MNNPRLSCIKDSSLEGAKAGLMIGAVAGFATKLVGHRVPLFHVRFRQYDMTSHVLVGGLSFCAMGALMAGRDIFRYLADISQRQKKSSPPEDAEMHAADRVIGHVTGYRAHIVQNQVDIIARMDEAYAIRQEAIRRYKESQGRH